MREPILGDWVKPKGGALPGRGSRCGRIVGEGTFTRLAIPVWRVNDGKRIEAVPKDAVEFWFRPE